jgi:hypothetical protein
MRLQPLRQWYCDECGELIERPRDGTVAYDSIREPSGEWHAVRFRIVHNGNVRNGECQGSPGGGAVLGDKLLEDLAGSRAILSMLGTQSSDPTWAEVVRRVAVPLYEEARRYFRAAVSAGEEIIHDKLTDEKLTRIIATYGN